MLNVIMILNF